MTFTTGCGLEVHIQSTIVAPFPASASWAIPELDPVNWGPLPLPDTHRPL